MVGDHVVAVQGDDVLGNGHGHRLVRREVRVGINRQREGRAVVAVSSVMVATGGAYDLDREGVQRSGVHRFAELNAYVSIACDHGAAGNWVCGNDSNAGLRGFKLANGP